MFQRTAAYAVPAHNGAARSAHTRRGSRPTTPGFRARNRRKLTAFGSELPTNPLSALAVERRGARGGVRGTLAHRRASACWALRDSARCARQRAGRRVRARQDPRGRARPGNRPRCCRPHQTIGCKRMCVDTGYYETYNRPNVRLVDVSQHPIDEITPAGLTTNGREYAFDALVLATGFDAMTGTLMRLDLRGRDGLRIQRQVARRPAQLPRPDDRGLPEPVQRRRPRQPLGVHQRDRVDRAPRGLDRRLHRAISMRTATRPSKRPSRPKRAWVAHVNAVAQRTVFLTCNSWYLGANIPGKPRDVHAAVRLPALRREMRRGRAQRLRRVRVGLDWQVATLVRNRSVYRKFGRRVMPRVPFDLRRSYRGASR